MPQTQLNEQQRQQCQALGLDWQSVPWDKLGRLLQLLLTFLQTDGGVAPRQSVTPGSEAYETPKTHDGHCDHKVCALQVAQCALHTAECAVAHYWSCCQEEGDDSDFHGTESSSRAPTAPGSPGGVEPTQSPNKQELNPDPARQPFLGGAGETTPPGKKSK